MPEVNKVSPILPVAAAAPVQASAGNNAVSQGSDSPAFSQVLRDKQAAANDASKPTAQSPANAAAKGKSDQTKDTDDKGAAALKDASAQTEAAPQTPAEMAQLLAAAGLMGTVQTTPQAPATNTAPATDPAAKVASDPGALTALPTTDKIAAPALAAPASAAAGTTPTTTSATSTAQPLLGQSQSAQPDSKGSDAGTPGGDPQTTDKPTVLSVSGQGETEKNHATASDSDTSFAAALERASQNGDVARSSAMTNATPVQTAQAPATTHTVNTPVGNQGWADEVGQRVLWTAKSDSSRADLILTPPQLGRIEVSIHMNGDQANASFMVANPVAREALQDAMPKLRELMSQAGVQLGQADVSAGQSGQNNAQGESGRRGGGSGMRGGLIGMDGLSGAGTSQWTRQGTGLVDTFA